MNLPPPAAAAAAACGRLFKRAMPGPDARRASGSTARHSAAGAEHPPRAPQRGCSELRGLPAKLILLHMHERMAFPLCNRPGVLR